MALSTGDRAPDFTLYDSAHQPFTLSESGDRQVVLLFFPGAFTSVCTDELTTVGNDLARWQDAGAEIVGISTDSPFALAEPVPLTLANLMTKSLILTSLIYKNFSSTDGHR